MNLHETLDAIRICALGAYTTPDDEPTRRRLLVNLLRLAEDAVAELGTPEPAAVPPADDPLAVFTPGDPPADGEVSSPAELAEFLRTLDDGLTELRTAQLKSMRAVLKRFVAEEEPSS
jgi:hypothetical protein